MNYNTQIADTIKYTLKDPLVCIIKEQCADHGQGTQRY
jgi:hypothetical protein